MNQTRSLVIPFLAVLLVACIPATQTPAIATLDEKVTLSVTAELTVTQSPTVIPTVATAEPEPTATITQPPATATEIKASPTPTAVATEKVLQPDKYGVYHVKDVQELAPLLLSPDEATKFAEEHGGVYKLSPGTVNTYKGGEWSSIEGLVFMVSGVPIRVDVESDKQETLIFIPAIIRVGITGRAVNTFLVAHDRFGITKKDYSAGQIRKYDRAVQEMYFTPGSILGATIPLKINDPNTDLAFEEYGMQTEALREYLKGVKGDESIEGFIVFGILWSILV